MKKRWLAAAITLVLACLLALPAGAAELPRSSTPDYRVAFYAFDCYHMEDENGHRSGYGYEMMEKISRYLQCTFSYVGYDKTAQESVDLLRTGQVDLYTAAKKTPEREAEFAFSTHPAITATTCMNVKVGNTKVVSGDYSTYNGLRVGLLARHTYNNAFLDFAREKGFTCEISYYETPTELSHALIHGEVDALVNSYIRTPDDEQTVENFGQTPYYIMARKEDQPLIDAIDSAIDQMNIETPNWRTELYDRYYGSEEHNTEFTPAEQALLKTLQAQGAVIRGVMDPNGNPYSWYEDGEGKGIAADMFRAAAQSLGLSCEIVPVDDREALYGVLSSGAADVWLDMDSGDAGEFTGGCRYKATDPYLTATVSLLRTRDASDGIHRLAVTKADTAIQEIFSATWPEVETVELEDTDACIRAILNREVDGALLMSYTAQKLAQNDLQNRLRVDIVQGVTLDLRMGVNAGVDRDFYGLWEKTLSQVAEQQLAQIVQQNVSAISVPSMLAYLFDHPMLLVVTVIAVLLIAFLLVLYVQSMRSENRQQRISKELAAALEEARQANAAKQDFFSKMSHDIRTPLNVVLGMTQIAQKYKEDTPRLESALSSISSEGSYLLSMINSILDVSQLEHGQIELAHEPFAPLACVEESVEILRPLAAKKQQQLTLRAPCQGVVLVGDAGRFSQIMVNILSNAIKYTDDGGRIAVTLEMTGENRCRFTCRDNGIGMTQEFIQHITEDYTRAEDSRVSKTQGTGLGMSVVKGFTDRMGGTLQIESKLGEGSCFTVELPFEAATPAQKENVLHPPKQHPQDQPRYRGKRALLVEDNELNAEIATELLQSIGLQVDWAENGAVAVERFTASQPGTYFAVFMDMQMPVMDGVEATRRIRASGHADCHVPIFAMTANTFATDRQRCRDAGMDGYIPKPINIGVIESALEKGTRPEKDLNDP